MPTAPHHRSLPAAYLRPSGHLIVLGDYECPIITLRRDGDNMVIVASTPGGCERLVVPLYAHVTVAA